MQVKDAMHEKIEWINPDAPVSEIAVKMRDCDVGAMPVCENDELVGMVTDRDITCRAVASGSDLDTMTARDVMTEGITYCRDTEEVEDAIRIMESKKIRRLPVMDKDKKVVGMLSLGDISEAVPQSLAGEVLKGVSSHHG